MVCLYHQFLAKLGMVYGIVLPTSTHCKRGIFRRLRDPNSGRLTIRFSLLRKGYKLYNCGCISLVGGLEHFFFPYIGNVIIPTDALIFFRGVSIPPTRYIYIYIKQIDRFSPWQGLEPRTMKSFSQDLLQRDDLMGLEDLRGFHVDLPSGYDWHSHGKWPIEIDGLPEFTY